MGRIPCLARGAREETRYSNAGGAAEGTARVVAERSSLAAFKVCLGEADGVLIATPEYNDGIPGVLTNAIDWGSRLPGLAPPEFLGRGLT